MKGRRLTYKEMKLKQQMDIKRKPGDPYWAKDLYNFYRNFSTPFTYLFVKLNISSSAVSILSFFPNIIGYFLLSTGNHFFMIFGLLFFILYKVLDCSDGEVARIQNPKAVIDPRHKITEGSYFDAVGHFIEPICLGAGLGVGLFYLYNSGIYITFGIILSIILTLEFAVGELVRSYFRRGIIERKIKLKKELKYVQKQLTEKINEGRSWSKQNIFLKLLGIYPQGLIYSREFFDLILIFLILVEYSLSIYIDIPFVIFGQMIGILSIYLLVVAIVKLIKIISFIYKMEKNKYITDFLNEYKT